MLNKVLLIGRLTRDVELKSTPNGKQVATASLATSKKFKNQAGEFIEQSQFHNLVIWQGAENFAKYLSKGSKVYLEGELSTSNWEKDGVKQYKTEIVVNNFIFLDNKSDNAKPAQQVTEQKTKVADLFPEDKVLEEDDEIRVSAIPF